MFIDKSHSRNDLIDLINTLNLPVVFSHVDNKKNIQDKLVDLIQNKKNHKPFDTNTVYNIKSYTELMGYLKAMNPKKLLSVKEKADIMILCKHIISYCNLGYKIELSTYYNNKQDIIDDMNYIKQFGDIPSVRRCCKLMNKDQKQDEYFIPKISPQIQKKLNDKVYTQQKIYGKLKVEKGEFTVTFS